MKRAASILVAVACAAWAMAVPARAEADDPLDRRISLKLTHVPLGQALEAIAAQGGLRVACDWGDDADGAAETPISLDLRMVRLRTALRLAARQRLDPNERDVRITPLPGGGVRIAALTRDASGPPVTRRYDVRRLTGRIEEFDQALADLIMSHVAPDGWIANGGQAGTITFDGREMVVTCGRDDHDDVAAVLEAIARPAPPGSLPENLRRTMEAPARLTALAALGRPIVGPVPRSLTLREVEQALLDRGVQAYFDWRGLEAAGFDPDAIVEVPAGAAAPEVMTAFAESAGSAVGTDIDAEGVAIITSADRAVGRPVLGAYDLRPFADQPLLVETLPWVLKETVMPESWVDNGGRFGNAVSFGYTMAIVQTPDVHERVAGLLAMLTDPAIPPALPRHVGRALRQAPEQTVLAVYDVGPLAEEEERAVELRTTIVETIDRESWLENGGRDGTLYFLGRLMLVRQTPDNHAQVARLLARFTAGEGEAPDPRRQEDP